MASSNHPWKDGYWRNSEAEAFIIIIKGESTQTKKLASLALPDVKSIIDGRITCGNFGPAPEDIATASGIKTYNIQMEYPDFGRIDPGVLNNEGMYSFIYRV